jgi:rSAM/selenodomain-associated transferase 2
VDRPEDIPIWEKIVQQEGSSNKDFSSVISPGLISVIVPTLNEATEIQSAIETVVCEENVEIIVVDGGSQDNTAEIVRQLRVEVITSSDWRSRQMNTGAEHASGDILLFLHADTRLPLGWSRQVRKAIDQPGIAAGAFELKLDQVFPWSRIIEKLANLRSRVFQMPYGDQAIFVKADLFRSMEGYSDLPIMEDYEFMRRVRRHGRILIVPCPAVTSARRWTKIGPLRTTLVNQIMLVGYWLGVSSHFLRRLYRQGTS